MSLHKSGAEPRFREGRRLLLLIEDMALNLRLHRYLQSRGYKWV
jgi:hypothetical protein